MRLKSIGDVEMSRLILADQIRFEFVPFEVSHLFHLDAQAKNSGYFIVSCANHTLGYLPHPRQLRAGGYEVDGSRGVMGLDQRVEFEGDSPW